MAQGGLRGGLSARTIMRATSTVPPLMPQMGQCTRAMLAKTVRAADEVIE